MKDGAKAGAKDTGPVPESLDSALIEFREAAKRLDDAIRVKLKHETSGLSEKMDTAARRALKEMSAALNSTAKKLEQEHPKAEPSPAR